MRIKNGAMERWSLLKNEKVAKEFEKTEKTLERKGRKKERQDIGSEK